MRKTITAVAIGAIPSVLFDNLDIQLGGAALDGRQFGRRVRGFVGRVTLYYLVGIDHGWISMCKAVILSPKER